MGTSTGATVGEDAASVGTATATTGPWGGLAVLALAAGSAIYSATNKPSTPDMPQSPQTPKVPESPTGNLAASAPGAQGQAATLGGTLVGQAPSEGVGLSPDLPKKRSLGS